MCGSAQYMAPELHASAGDGYLGPPVDMWALGAMLYEMLHGKPQAPNPKPQTPDPRP